MMSLQSTFSAPRSVTKFVTLACAAFVLAGVVVSAGATSTSLTVGVTVVRSCVVDAQPADGSLVHVTCAPGAAQGLRISGPMQTPTAATRLPSSTTSEAPAGQQMVTLNF